MKAKIYELTGTLLAQINRESEIFDEEYLAGFLATQKLALLCAKDIGLELQEGWTEKQTAELMDTYLRDCGVRAFFHQSFAWFGDHTRFQGFTNPLHYLPSQRCLQAGDVVILDTAPIFKGATVDIGYTFSKAPNPELAEAKTFLNELRTLLPGLFESDLTSSEIWAEIDRRITERGFDNIHQMYPFAVLGHRVHRVPLSHLPSVTFPFGLHSFYSLLSRGLTPELLGPKHKGSKEGLWAIEPHIGGLGFGAKFEEILVVQNGRAHWLDSGGTL